MQLTANVLAADDQSALLLVWDSYCGRLCTSIKEQSSLLSFVFILQRCRQCNSVQAVCCYGA